MTTSSPVTSPRPRAALEIVPVTFRQAATFIAAHHRHHGPPQGMKFTLGVAHDAGLVGVAVVGRPLARHFDDGRTAEITRTCTDGTPNANSKLYAASWQATRALGYRRLITYTHHRVCRTCDRTEDVHTTDAGTRPGRRIVAPPSGCAHHGCTCPRYESGETGASLRAVGFRATAHLPAHRGWDRPSRHRQPQRHTVPRTRWEICRTPNRTRRTGHRHRGDDPPHASGTATLRTRHPGGHDDKPPADHDQEHAHSARSRGRCCACTADEPRA